MLQRGRHRLAAAAAASALAMPVALAFAPMAAAQESRPDFQLPFPCGQTWRLDTWAHAPALDMVREPDQEGTEGAQLVAPAGGVVNKSFRHDNAGHVVQIDHGDGWFTTYLHLQDRSVEVGEDVAQGDEIGHVGRTGPTSNNHPHLHFEAAVDEDGDGEASWGFEGSERVRPWFDGVEYGQANSRTSRDVESRNCPQEPGSTTTTTAAAAPTTAAPTTTAGAPTTTTSVPATTTTAAAATPTTAAPPPTTATSVAPSTITTQPSSEAPGGATLPKTGTSTTLVAAAVGAALLAVGGALVLARRRLTSR